MRLRDWILAHFPFTRENNKTTEKSDEAVVVILSVSRPLEVVLAKKALEVYVLEAFRPPVSR